MGLAALARGNVPIIVPAKDFGGNLRDVVNRKAALLDARSAAAVISAARKLRCAMLVSRDLAPRSPGPYSVDPVPDRQINSRLAILRLLVPRRGWR